MGMQEYFVKYDITSKTQYVIEDDKVVSKVKFDICPYVWFGKFKEKIESGLVEFVMWKRHRMAK